MTTLKPLERVHINKIGVIFFALMGLLVGITPAVLAIDRLEAMIFFIIATLIGASIGVKGSKSLATEKPSLLEFIIGFIGSIFWGVFTSFFLLIPYIISLGVVYLLEIIANLLGFGIQLDANFIAYVISGIIGVFASLVWSSVAAEDLAKQLYPNKAQIKSVFYELVNNRRALIGYIGFALFVLVGIIMIVWYVTGVSTVWNVWWFNIILLLDLLFVSLSTFSMGDKFDPKLPRVVEAVSKLLKASGYKVLPSPITGKPDFDPLLAGLDFFAQKKQQALAVVVRTENSKLYDRWNPSDLLRSRWVLEELFQEKQNGTHRVTPVVFYNGKEKEKWKEKVEVIKITDKQIAKILSDSKEEMKKIRRRYSGIFLKDKDSSALKDNLHKKGGEM